MTHAATHRSRLGGRVLAAAVAALALQPGAAPAAEAQPFAAANGPIVFERSGAVVTTPPTGGIPTLLAPGSYDPAVSPEGSRIAYVHARNIWMMRSDGSDKRAVTVDGRFNDDPAWSADGTKIAYSGMPSARPDLFVIPAGGGTPLNLTNSPDNAEHSPAFSPDGRQIAYVRSGCEVARAGGSCIYVMSAGGGAAVNLTPERRVPGCEDGPGYSFHGASLHPAWSPDSRRIAFTGPLTCPSTLGTDIWIMARTGASKTNLNRDNRTTDRQASFSPDGRRIVFARAGTGLFTMTTNGGGHRRLTTGIDSNPHWGVGA